MFHSSTIHWKHIHSMPPLYRAPGLEVTMPWSPSRGLATTASSPPSDGPLLRSMWHLQAAHRQAGRQAGPTFWIIVLSNNDLVWSWGQRRRHGRLWGWGHFLPFFFII
jgi:hypothetical protein